MVEKLHLADAFLCSFQRLVGAAKIFPFAGFYLIPTFSFLIMGGILKEWDANGGIRVSKPRLERIVQFALPVGSKFGVLPGDVEHVGGGSALCVNQAYLYVASK